MKTFSKGLGFIVNRSFQWSSRNFFISKHNLWKISRVFCSHWLYRKRMRKIKVITIVHSWYSKIMIKRPSTSSQVITITIIWPFMILPRFHLILWFHIEIYHKKVLYYFREVDSKSTRNIPTPHCQFNWLFN